MEADFERFEKKEKKHVHEQVVKPNTLFTNEAAFFVLKCEK